MVKHHAYLLEGNIKEAGERAEIFLSENFGLTTHANPDFTFSTFTKFGIDDARELIEEHKSKSVSTDGHRIFCISTENITVEAQNALLKVFEEPYPGTVFLIFVPSNIFLLPTFLSRVQKIGDTAESETPHIKELNKVASDFLSMKIKDRLSFVDKFVKSISDEKKSRMDAIEFIDALTVNERKLHGVKNPDFLKILLKSREYLQDRSSSIKQILELVALSDK